MQPLCDAATSGAFVEEFFLPPVRSGKLDGLAFAVKDNIDIKGHATSFGSPAWGKTHAVPVHNAVCVDQLLAEGATCIGKVVADELTYSLDGENPFFGTPLNPKVPEGIPGGSSSGSASSVACGLADFSLGTDSGGSVRVPASLCGVWGMRPSLHRISEAGVIPFMPSVSTVGVLAAEKRVLDKVADVLLCLDGDRNLTQPGKAFLLEDAFALADADVADAAREKLVQMARRAGIMLESVSFADIVGEDRPLSDCNRKALRDVQTMEFESTVGNWIETSRPQLGPTFVKAYRNVQTFDRMAAMESLAVREHLSLRMNAFLSAGNIICFPTTPVPAPRKGSLNTLAAVVDFYDRAMTLSAFSGVGRLPEVSMPGIDVRGRPVGLSFVAAHDEDAFLLAAVNAVLEEM